MSSKPARRWMATIHDLTWDPFKGNLDKISFLRGQEEICPKTKRHHYQIYFKLKEPMRMPAAKRTLGSETAHLDCCRGTHEECVAYVSKEDSRAPDGKTFKVGEDEEVGQGARNDVRSAFRHFNNGGIAEVIDKQPEYAFKHAKQLKEYALLEQMYKYQGHFKDIMVIFAQGRPRVGKTTGVFATFGSAVYRAFIQDDGRVWFDGYNPDLHKVLFIDDIQPMDKSRFKTDFWLKHLDGYIDNIQTKGGFTRSAWNVVILVSNYSIEQCFGSDPTSPIRQRIHLEVKNAGDKFWIMRALSKAGSHFCDPFILKSFHDLWNKEHRYGGEDIQDMTGLWNREYTKNKCTPTEEKPENNQDEQPLDGWTDNEDGDDPELFNQAALDSEDDDFDSDSAVGPPSAGLGLIHESDSDDGLPIMSSSSGPKRTYQGLPPLRRKRARFLDSDDE